MKKTIVTWIVILIILAIGLLRAPSASRQETPTQTKPRIWTTIDSKMYARDLLEKETHKQYTCLVKLWRLESNWRPNAFNKVKVMGKNAVGIPQLLGMERNLPATVQIDRGLAYIYARYATPCIALSHELRRGWY